MGNKESQYSLFEVTKKNNRIVFHARKDGAETKISVNKIDAKIIANEIARLTDE